jgi:hypothetical protein
VIAVLALVGGCSDAGGYRGAGTPTPAPSATFPFDPAILETGCRFVDDEARQHSVALKLSFRGDWGKPTRDEVAAAFDSLGRRLAFLAISGAPPDLITVLSEWADASTEVGQYLAETTPRKGSEIDYGPSYPRWTEAKKATEKLCGYPLPNPAVT